MRTNEEMMLERFKNLLAVKNDLSLEGINTNFTEYELKYLIWLIGDYIAIKNANKAESEEQYD